MDTSCSSLQLAKQLSPGFVKRYFLSHRYGVIKNRSDPDMANSILQQLTPYELSSFDITGLEDEDSRGRGAFGIVYAVTVQGMPRIAKRLHDIFVNAEVDKSDKQGIRERFLNECLLLSKLDHPNVVKFIGVHFNPQDRSDVTLIMERLHMDLYKFLECCPDIDLFIKLSILHDVSSGLLYLHTQLAKPIIHRDLTARNVLLTEDFKQAKIADLGVSKLIDSHHQRVAIHSVCPGNFAYMPPEAISDDKEAKLKYDTSLDIFSFGHLTLCVALEQNISVVLTSYELSLINSACELGETAILQRKKWLDKLPKDHCLRNLILSCLRDYPSERPSIEVVYVKMKVLCGFDLEDFEIEDVKGMENGEMYGSYTAVCKVVARGAPRIAKGLNSILKSQLVSDISPSERQRIREQFNNDCLILSKLDHSNILKFIGVHFNPEDRSDMAVIFEHLHMSLEEFLNPQEFPDIHLNTKLSILHDVSSGLLYLHTQLEMPHVHGELTAANVLLTDDWKQAKIADLGILKLLQNSRVNVKDDKCSARALAYLPPEACFESFENLRYNIPVDVFSFGHLALYVALQQLPEIPPREEVSTASHKKCETEVLRRKKWINELGHNHCLRDLILACLKDKPEKRPNISEVNNIMNTLNNVNNPEKTTKHNKTLQNQFAELCCICRNGEQNLLKEFLYYNYRKDILKCFTPKGTTILHEAVEGDQPDVVQLMLLHGFDPNVCARGGLTPLHLAVIKGQVDCVRALINNGADISVKDDQGQDAITKAERNRQGTIFKYLRSKEIMILAEKGDVQQLEARLKKSPKPEVRDMEEAMLMAVRKGNDECIPHLILAGARGIDCVLCLAIQFENIKAIAILLLCRAAITGDSTTIHSLISEPAPPESANIPWYVPRVREILSQDIVNMSYPIVLSVLEKKYEATKELLLKTNVNMSHKHVDWSNLELTIFDSSWMYSIAPWVLSLKLANNHLIKLPSEMVTATQLKRLDLSQNLLKSVSMDLFSLPNLEYLSLRLNRLEELPETDSWSASLLHLDLSENLLSTLPLSIRYSSIKTLNLSKNQFTIVPKCLCRIHTLTSLDLRNMQITSLPKEMENLQNLVNLNISNTSITNLQITGGGVLHGEIRGKIRVPGRFKYKPCNHVKLVILCHSDLVKKIVLSELKPNFNPSQLQSNQPLPEIDVFQWNFKPLLSRKDKLYFNTWMLGSPYSCRFIYPCFFTSEGLYVIELNLTVTVDLKVQIRAHFDLLVRYISSAANIKIFVIAVLHKGLGIKKTQETLTSLTATLSAFISKPSYKNLSYLGVLMVVANPNVKDRQGDLQQQLYDAAQKMIIKGKHIVPESYFSLISILEEKQQILGSEPKVVVLRESSLRNVFDKIHSSDPPDKKELESMVEFLKKVGLLLHYTDVPNSKLDQYYFISPVWLYNTLLHVVCQALEHHSSLFVTYSELCSLINSRDEDIGQAIIQLMVHYAIVLPTSRYQYLITCLLHSQPPSEAIYCGLLRRQFAPNLRCLPVDLWSRLLSCIISNLPEIIDVNELKKESIENDFDKEDATCNQQAVGIAGDTQILTSSEELLSRSLNLQARPQDQHFSITEGSTSTLQRHASALVEESNSSRHSHYVEPATIHEMGIQIWDSGIIYNHNGIKFSIFRCVSEVFTVEERGIEICCAQYNYGYAIMARLCWLVQSYLEENFPDLFSTKTLPQERELTQNAVCPTCLKRSEKEPSCFSVDTCIHAIRFKREHNCSRHPETILLRDLIPDYLMLDFPSHLCLSKTMFDYNEKRPFQTNERTSLHNGHFSGKEIVVKIYHQEDIYKRTITLPLSYVRRESAMLSSLDHPNIIKIFGFCLDLACILVEKAPLGNLHQILMNYNTAEKVSKITQFHISCQAASALSYLNRHSIIYRVLKANSIFVWSLEFNFDASIKLANFEQAAYQTQSGLMGKTTFCSYPPPEILKHSYREEKEDIIAFGILLYDLVTRYRQPHSRKPRLSNAVTSNNRTMAKLMEECLQEEAMARPSAIDLLLQISQPSFQCLVVSQVLRDFISVERCCFVPSVQQIWVYGEYKMIIPRGEGGVTSDGMQIFILNAENLMVQGSLELRDRATFIFTVNSQVWIGMTEMCIHVYDTTTFCFTNRFYLDDSVATITDNDCYVFVGQANGHIKCYSKVKLERGDCQPIDIQIGDKTIEAMVTTGDTVWAGCGNELVMIHSEDEIKIVQRAVACEPPNHVSLLTVSYSTGTVWCVTSNSLSITSWDIHTTGQKYITDLTEYFESIKFCHETNYESDPSFLEILSIECVSDTLWVGLSCGVIMILSDKEQPEMITHFKAHRQGVECLLKIPHSSEVHQEHEYPLILSGGYGEVSSLSSMISEQNGVVMLWHAFTAHEFSTISKRHTNYHSTSIY